MIHTTGSASRATGVPVSTMLSWESTGAIPRFERDVNGKRLITEDDIARISAYAIGRRNAQGAELEAAVQVIDMESQE